MKKIIAMLLCVALVASLGMSALAATDIYEELTAASVAVGDDGAGLVIVTSGKTLTTAKSVADYLKEKTTPVAKSVTRLAAEAAKNAYEAQMVAAAEALKVANDQLKWAKADYNATAKAMTAAAKAAITAYQDIYKAAVAQQIALEYLDFGVQYSNAMNEAIADMQIALVDALPAGTDVVIAGIGLTD